MKRATGLNRMIRWLVTAGWLFFRRQSSSSERQEVVLRTTDGYELCTWLTV